MINVKNKLDIYKHFESYLSLNIKGVLHNTDYEVYVDDLNTPNGIWIKDAYFSFVYAKNQAFVELFDQTIQADSFGFSGTNKVVLDYYMDKDHTLIHWTNTCNQYHYGGQRFEDVEGLDSLTLEDAEFVDNNYEYKNDHSLAKIQEAIKNRPTSCKRIDGQLIAFVLLHNDDSIGYMYTLPEYRGHGYAYELTKDIINKTLDSGRLPYIQIVESNDKSIGLAKKAGFIEHGQVYWFGITRQGQDFKKYLRKYEDLYGLKPGSVSVHTTLKLKHQAIDIHYEDKQVTYMDKVYDFEYTYEDEIYYVKTHMPEAVLIATLMQLMQEDWQMCIVNQKLHSKCFQDAIDY